MAQKPLVSILIPVRRAETTLTKTLASIQEATRLATENGKECEIIVAFSKADSTAKLIESKPMPAVRYVRMKNMQSIPQLRGEALQAARGDFVLLAEDHFQVPETWVMTMLEAAEAHPECGGWGGPIRNGRQDWLGWVHYLIRYANFLPTNATAANASEEVKSLPGGNAMYRRSQLSQMAGRWEKGFWEAELQPTIRAKFGPFRMVPEAAVRQHQQRGWWEFFWLRLRHGRVYGGRHRDGLSLLAPVVAIKLWRRAAKAVGSHGEYSSIFYSSTPLLLFYCLAWACGETLGFVFGAGGAQQRTD